MPLYQYVGPREIQHAQIAAIRPRPIESLNKLLKSLLGLGFQRHPDVSLTVTFVIDADGQLRIADQHSEHVACATPAGVQSAGEMSFAWEAERLIVLAITNQSTGFCPEPASWPAVELALNKIGIEHPGEFEPSFEFRRCVHCSQTNIIKDQWFVCDVCGAALPAHWNYGETL